MYDDSVIMDDVGSDMHSTRNGFKNGGGGGGGVMLKHSHKNHASSSLTTTTTSYADNLAKSMSIDEMRGLHKRASADAEAKQTELRLVLASRYRELVGSSDEVVLMQQQARELDSMLKSLPPLMDQLFYHSQYNPSLSTSATNNLENDNNDKNNNKNNFITATDSSSRVIGQPGRHARLILLCLDKGDIHGAASSLIELMRIMAMVLPKETYPLVHRLAKQQQPQEEEEEEEEQQISCSRSSNMQLAVQMKMTYWHVQTLPARTLSMAKRVLCQADIPVEEIARALSSMDLLSSHSCSHSSEQRASRLFDLYFDSKAKLLQSLLTKLDIFTSTKSSSASSSSIISTHNMNTDQAEEVLCQIVRLLQYDVILVPYQIFCCGKFTQQPTEQQRAVLTSMPAFDSHLLTSKVSHFFASHLPLIRTKAEAVLAAIAGTTASRLGQIRQSLYDTTEGMDRIQHLNSNGICTYPHALATLIDIKILATTNSQAIDKDKRDSMLLPGGKFSLWAALFSNTFSSLVHSLLTTSFHSVHTKVLQTLRSSLAHAPPMPLPHEAYRNSLTIATDLDQALHKVSNDAHELLVHAEERDESERRLRQSLYVQTCEIMGRLLNELRRMLLPTDYNTTNNNNNNNHHYYSSSSSSCTRELILGRLCHLLKFRLTSLSTLLDPNSSPAKMTSGKTRGMITIAELQSSFHIADDDDDGLLSFSEAMEAMEAAFSGTPFHGTEMVRETMLLTSTNNTNNNNNHNNSTNKNNVNSITSSTTNASTYNQNLTLSELALLSARGLRHSSKGHFSALGIIQQSLDHIIHSCFVKWSKVMLSSHNATLIRSTQQSVQSAFQMINAEWKRCHTNANNHSTMDDSLQDEIGDFLTQEAENKEPESNNNHDPKESKSMMVETKDIPTVSPYILSYLLSVVSILNHSISPTDSLPPVPSLEYASKMGISASFFSPKEDNDDQYNTTDISSLSMVTTIRGALVQEAFQTLTQTMSKECITKLFNKHQEESQSSSDESSQKFITAPLALVQFYTDISFIQYCFMIRNNFGLIPSSSQNKKEEEFMDHDDDDDQSTDDNVSTNPSLLEDMLSQLLSEINNQGLSMEFKDLSVLMMKKHKEVLGPCEMFLSSLFGEFDNIAGNKVTESNAFNTLNPAISTTDNLSLYNPLPSSRRFNLLPIQTERTISELQMLGKANRKKEQTTTSTPAKSGVASGFGFFSSMLKTN